MRHRYGEKRVIGLLLAPAVVVTALSTVSFAQPRQVGAVTGWEIVLEGELIDDIIGEEEFGLASRSMASPSLAAQIDQNNDISEMTIINDEERVRVDWKKALFNNSVIYDTGDPELRPEYGLELFDDGIVEVQSRVIIPEARAVGEGDEVEWNIGQIPGLNLRPESQGAMVLHGILIGYASLCYSDDGMISIRTEFTDGMHSFQTVYITYNYSARWNTVSQRTPIRIQMDGWAENSLIYLLPVGGEEPTTEEPTTEEPATEEPTTEEPTTEEPTTEEPTTEEPTTEEPTTEEPTTEEPTTEEPTTEEPTTEEPTTEGSIHWQPGRSSGGSGSTTVRRRPDQETEVISSEEIAAQTESAGEDDQTVDEPQEKPQEKTAATQEEEIVEPVITVEMMENSGDYIEAGSEINYQIEIRNESDQVIEDLRIRDYLPDHTSFVSKDELGVYGIIDGKQHVTWNVEKLEPGETRYCRLTVKVFICVPENYPIENRIYYQADDKTAVNDPRDPQTEAVTSSLSVG